MTLAIAETAAGNEAYRLLEWASEDPSGRAAEVRDQIAALQQRETDPAAKREISDAARIALRL